MKIALELEFPDEQAASALRWLQTLPNGLIAQFQGRPTSPPASLAGLGAESPEAELKQLFREFAGSWQSDENGDELARQLQEARQDQPRDVEL